MSPLRLCFLLLLLSAGCSRGNSPSNLIDSSQARIVNGTEVHDSDMARGGFANSTVRLYIDDGYCTGTLIAPTLILTSAHCVTEAANALNTYAVFQTANLTGNMPGDHAIRAATFVVHPDYHASDSWDLDQVTRDSKDDIALILLRAPAPKSVQPALLASGNDGLSSFSAVTAVGFGSSSWTFRNDDVGDGILRSTSFRTGELQIENGMIVAADSKTAICHGDSGGPLYAGAGSSTQNTVVGVNDFILPHPTSFFRRMHYRSSVVHGHNLEAYAKSRPDEELCGESGFVDVASHRDWIIKAAAHLGVSVRRTFPGDDEL